MNSQAPEETGASCLPSSCVGTHLSIVTSQPPLIFQVMRTSRLLALVLLAACGQDPLGSPTDHGAVTGVVSLVVALSPGGTPDTSGFAVQFSSGAFFLIPSAGTVQFVGGVDSGTTASITIADPWCRTPHARQAIPVVAGDTTELRFMIDCDLIQSTARVIIRTSARNPDPDGYEIRAGGVTVAVAANDTLIVHGLAWQPLQVTLAGLAPWCTAPARERDFGFDRADTAVATFDVTCDQTMLTRAHLVVEQLGALPSSTIYLRIGDSLRIALAAGADTVVWVRRDQIALSVDSVGRNCASFVAPDLALATDTSDVPPPTHLRFGCGRLSGLSERTFTPMVLLETGLDGRDTVVLGQGLNHPYDGKLSHDGHWIVGEQYRYNFADSLYEWRSYRENVGGGDFRVLTDWTADRFINPSWGPDDDHITFVAQTPPAPPYGIRYPRVVISDRDGTNPDTMRIHSYGIARAAWSPQGDRLAFTGWCQSEYYCPSGIDIVTPGDSTPKIFPAHFYGSGELAWSPDGTRIAFVGDSGRIHVLRLSDGHVTTVASSPSAYQDEAPEWDPSGQMIGWIRIDPDSNAQPFHWAFVAPADGGPEVKILQQRMFVGPFWHR